MYILIYKPYSKYSAKKLQALKGNIALKNAMIITLVAEGLEYCERLICIIRSFSLIGRNINGYIPFLHRILKKSISVSITAIN